MKIKTTFKRMSLRGGTSYAKLKIFMRFEYCEYNDFLLWLKNNKERLAQFDHDIGFGDQVILINGKYE